METKKKYTYDDWWNGDVTLVFASKVWTDVEPVVATWDDFSEEDVARIKEKQRSMFNDQVQELFSSFCAEFIAGYGRSEMQKKLLSDEIQACYGILFKPIPKAETVIYSHWNLSLDYYTCIGIQEYVKHTLERGQEYSCADIHSPNCKYQEKKKPKAKVSAHAIWKYYKWLKQRFVSDYSDDRRTKELWFQVGLLFAKGDIDRLAEKHMKGTMPNNSAIARELGNDSYRPYISESLSGLNRTDKNIFSSKEKTDFILRYCESHGITVVQSFFDRIKTSE